MQSQTVVALAVDDVAPNASSRMHLLLHPAVMREIRKRRRVVPDSVSVVVAVVVDHGLAVVVVQVALAAEGDDDDAPRRRTKTQPRRRESDRPRQ